MDRTGMAEPGARPKAMVQVLWVIGIFSLLRLAEAAFLGLGTDESYTVAVSRDLHLSYFDHPPIHYWMVHILSPWLAYGRGSRTPFIALFAVSTWLMFRLTRRLFGDAAGVWAALSLNLAGFFSVAAGDWVLPDGPLILCLLAASTVLADGWFPPPGTKPRPLATWLWAGFWIGLAALSKYQAAPYCVGVLAFVLSIKERRRELATPGPYLAGLLTLAILSPVIVWNAQHHWASFAFQGGRGEPRGFHPLGPVEALAGQMAILLPWVFIPLAAAAVSAWRGGRADKRRWFCLMLALPAIVLFSLSPLVGPRTLPHWSMPGWLFLFPLLGRGLSLARLDGRGWPRTWAIASLVVLLVVGALGLQEAATGWMGAAFPKLFKKGDPTAETIEWSDLRGVLRRQGVLDHPGVFVTALKWNEAGKIDQALGGAAPVLVFSNDPREFGYRTRSSAFLGHDAVILGRSETLQGALPALAPYFGTLSPAPPIAIGRGGRDEIEIDEVIGHNLLRPYPEPLR